MLQLEKVLQFGQFGGGEGAFFGQVDQFLVAALSLNGRAESEYGLRGGSRGYEIDDFLNALARGGPALRIPPGLSITFSILDPDGLESELRGRSSDG